MEPANDDELKKVQTYYDTFRAEGDTELKAAYRAITGAGFVEAVESERDKVKYRRPSDGKYIICSFPMSEELRPPVTAKPFRVVRFYI